MAAAALPMGTAQADEPVSPLVAAAISAVGYADEFEDVEAGPGSARATSTAVDYRAEFEDVEAGPGSARGDRLISCKAIRSGLTAISGTKVMPWPPATICIRV